METMRLYKKPQRNKAICHSKVGFAITKKSAQAKSLSGLYGERGSVSLLKSHCRTRSAKTDLYIPILHRDKFN